MGVGLMVEIRPFEVDDIPAVAALEAANQPQPWTEGILEDELAAENRSYLIAEDEGAFGLAGVIGFAGVMVVGEEAHVTNLLVAEEDRRRGVGKVLMLGLVDAALEMGARHLTLEVRSKNEAARSFYAHFGLAPIGVRKGYYGDDDALIMWVHDIDSETYAQGLEAIR
ncbi:MAG: ribosomal protein S18-alanine N-acetyltransferase [Acidobacteria bacterium]|nr:ribosomal protein S18-alanine N-acetyltransferase [Acidobacteriota bacterium]